MAKNLVKITSILLLGAIGGLLFQVFVLPYLINVSFLQDFQFVKNLKEREVIINPKEEIIIRENTALENAIEKVNKTVVAIKTETKTGKILEGSGLIVTSDGLIVTLAELVPTGSVFDIFIEEEKLGGRVDKRDVSENLALIKIEKTGLSTCSFADFQNIKLGERVFLIGTVFDANKVPQKIINEGIIKIFDEEYIKTNIFEKSVLRGSPLFNIEGSVLGLNTIDSEGKVIAIPAEKIQSFSGF